MSKLKPLDRGGLVTDHEIWLTSELWKKRAERDYENDN